MSWAIRQRLDPVPRLVLLALADRADKRGLAWPSVIWLAEFCGFHRSTILRELKRLVGLALIEDSGQRKGQTHQVKVWRLRLAEEGLPLPVPRRGKGISIGDALNGLKPFQGSETVSQLGNRFAGATGSRGRPVAPNAGKGIRGATRNQLEPKNMRGRVREEAAPRIFEVAPDWQPPQLPAGSKARQFVDHWSSAELGRHIRQFRRRAKIEGVSADLTQAWQAHVWRVEMEGGQ